MKTLMLALAVLGQLTFAQNPVAPGGAEGHGGGGDLEINYAIAGRRFIYFILYPADFDLTPLGEDQKKIFDRADALEKNVVKTHLFFMNEQKEQEHSEKYKTLYCFASQTPENVYLSRTVCGKEAASEEQAVEVLARVFLIRVGVENEEATMLAGKIRKVVSQRRIFNAADIIEAYPNWAENDKEGSAELERQKKNSPESAILTPEAFMEALKKDKEKALLGLGEHFPTEKPVWMQQLLWDWFVAYRDVLARDIKESKFIPRSVKEAKEVKQTTCALTRANVRFAPVYVVFEYCKTLVPTERLRIQLLAHESSHHLGIVDENTADLLGRAVGLMYQKK